MGCRDGSSRHRRPEQKNRRRQLASDEATHPIETSEATGSSSTLPIRTHHECDAISDGTSLTVALVADLGVPPTADRPGEDQNATHPTGADHSAAHAPDAVCLSKYAQPAHYTPDVTITRSRESSSPPLCPAPTAVLLKSCHWAEVLASGIDDSLRGPSAFPAWFEARQASSPLQHSPRDGEENTEGDGGRNNCSSYSESVISEADGRAATASPSLSETNQQHSRLSEFEAKKQSWSEFDLDPEISQRSERTAAASAVVQDSYVAFGAVAAVPRSYRGLWPGEWPALDDELAADVDVDEDDSTLENYRHS